MKTGLKILGILICYAVGCWFLFHCHYEYHGDTAAMCYYTPFGAMDYILLCLMTAVAIAATYYFALCKLRKRLLSTILCSAIYVAAALWMMICHTSILEYPTKCWPHEHHPIPIQNILTSKINN